MGQENLFDLQYVNRDGDSMRGPLTLAQAPIADMEAATKRYVDTVLANLRVSVVLRDGSLPMTGLLTLSGPPTALRHAGTRQYIDAASAAMGALMVRLDGSTPMTGLLTLSGAPVNPLHAGTRGYIDGLDAANLQLDGSRVMTGLLTLSGAPVNANHAATRAYVLGLDVLNLRLDGTRPMTGDLTLSALPTLPAHAASKAYVDALPTGLSTYDAVVAAAGGDYTSVLTACATEAAGARIFIKRGTYNEINNIQMKDGQQLIGENPEDTIIDFGAANRGITFVGGPTNLLIRDLTVQNSLANYTINLSGNFATVENCRILSAGGANSGVTFPGQYCILSNCYIDGFAAVNREGAAFPGANNKAIGNTFNNCSRGLTTVGGDADIIGNTFLTIGQRQCMIYAGSVVAGNTFSGGVQVDISGADVLVTGNYINGAVGLGFQGNFDNVVIAGNLFDGSQVSCNLATVSDVSITGNVFKGGAGILFRGFNSAISGNIFQGAAFLTLHADSHDNVINSNNLASSTNVPKIVDNGTANVAMKNGAMDSLSEKDFRRMENTSGGGLTAGDVVVLKAAAAGDEITTTVNQGDDMVFGMVEDANIANAAFGNIQVEGKTVKLKVNGTIAIGIGDLLGTFTAVGISMKAAAGDMAFAVALEAYAVADSNGVIDALLIKPRKV